MRPPHRLSRTRHCAISGVFSGLGVRYSCGICRTWQYILQRIHHTHTHTHKIHTLDYLTQMHRRQAYFRDNHHHHCTSRVSITQSKLSSEAVSRSSPPNRIIIGFHLLSPERAGSVADHHSFWHILAACGRELLLSRTALSSPEHPVSPCPLQNTAFCFFYRVFSARPSRNWFNACAE